MELYNREIKEKYLNTFENEDTRLTITYLLSKAASSEQLLGKDLCDFTDEQFGIVIRNTDPLNINVSVSNGRFFMGYVKWAKENGYSKSNINVLEGLDKEWYQQFVGDKKLFISEIELITIEDKLRNYQDKVVARLIFESVLGEGASELLNLKESDVDRENLTLTLTDDVKGQRTIPVSKRCIELVIGALGEREYEFRNGESKKRSAGELFENPYVLRTPKNIRTDANARTSKFNVYNRIKLIAEIENLPYLTAKQIQRSGMIKMAKDLYLKNGKLTKEEYDLIGDRFNLTKHESNGYMAYNVTNMNSFINADSIKELYGINIEQN